MKAAILERLKVSGEANRFKRSPLWEEAFNLYMDETKDVVSLGCSRCYKMVLKWLASTQ